MGKIVLLLFSQLSIIDHATPFAKKQLSYKAGGFVIQIQLPHMCYYYM